MKNKIKIIGIAAATLLTVAPVVTSTSSVLAAETAKVTTTTNNSVAYFTYNGQKLENNAVVPLKEGLPIKEGETLLDIYDAAKDTVKFVSPDSNSDITLDINSIATQLCNQNVSFVGGNRNAAKIVAPITGFNLTLTGSYSRRDASGKWINEKVNVIIPFGTGEIKNAPQFKMEYTQDGKTNTINPNSMTLQVAKDSKFNPTDFVGSNGTRYKISASQSDKDSKSTEIKVLKNDVDTSKAGSFSTVQLEAKNAEGKTSTITYTVLVTPEGKQRLNLMPSNWVRGLEDQQVFYQGDEYYVSNETKIEDGISYTKIYRDANKKSGTWIQTMYFANPYSAPTIVEKTVMHKSLVYSYGGGSKYRHYAAFRKIYVDSKPVEFKGQKYYQVYEKDGKYTSDYLKASNIDGTKRTLKHNAYIYATSTRRADRKVLKKGTKVITYGGSYKFKNGKRYYRIEGATKTNKRYVKVANFE